MTLNVGILMLHLLSLSSSTTLTKGGGKFCFVPYGSSVPKGTDGEHAHETLSVSCDGKVPGASLELTHWTDNATPDDLYADTSTEIALNFARARIDPGCHAYDRFDFGDDGEGEETTLEGEGRGGEGFLVLNNHYDTDGVLSVWACLDPRSALDWASLLVEGAEAGDFGEWSSDLGVKLDCALGAVMEGKGGGDEASAYEEALEVLPSLLDDLQMTGGMKHENLWRSGWDDAVRDWDAIVDGTAGASVTRGKGGIALVNEPCDGLTRLSCYALHRALRDKGLDGEQSNPATRVLRAKSSGGGSKWMYEYEKPGYGWVQRLVKRKPVPSVDGPNLVHRLNEKLGTEDDMSWKCGGSGGLVGICRTTGFVKTPPDAVLQALLEVDPGASE